MNLSKPSAGDTDWAGEINQNWTDIEKACTQGEGLTTIASAPPQISADQNNYTFSGGSPAYIFQRLSSDASRTITSIASGADGKHHILANVGSNSIVLANESASGTAANRILTGTGGSITLAPNERVDLVYDATTQRWRCGAKSNSLLSSGAVQSGQIGNAAVVSGSLASGHIGQYHLAPGAVRSGSIASDQIGWPHIASGIATWELIERKIISTPVASVTFNNLSGDMDNQYVLVGNIKRQGNTGTCTYRLKINGWASGLRSESSTWGAGIWQCWQILNGYMLFQAEGNYNHWAAFRCFIQAKRPPVSGQFRGIFADGYRNIVGYQTYAFTDAGQYNYYSGITSIGIDADVASGIGASDICLYRVRH